MLNPLLFPHRFLSTWPFSLSLYFFPLSFFLLLFFPFFFFFFFSLSRNLPRRSCKRRSIELSMRRQIRPFARSARSPLPRGVIRSKSPSLLHRWKVPVSARHVSPSLASTGWFRSEEERKKKKKEEERVTEGATCFRESLLRVVSAERNGVRHLSWFLTLELPTIRRNFLFLSKRIRTTVFETIFIFIY